MTVCASPADGIEEVFAAVGESVSLSCQNTSAVVEGGSVRWAMNGQMLSGNITTHKGLTLAPRLNSSLPHTRKKKNQAFSFVYLLKAPQHFS